MIKQLLRFVAVLRLAADAQAFRDRLVDQLLLRRLGKDHLERFIGNAAVDLFELEIAFEAPASYRSLLHFVRRVTEGEALVVEIAILVQARDDSLYDFFVRILATEQMLTQLGNGARLRGEEFDGALKCF